MLGVSWFLFSRLFFSSQKFNFHRVYNIQKYTGSLIMNPDQQMTSQPLKIQKMKSKSKRKNKNPYFMQGGQIDETYDIVRQISNRKRIKFLRQRLAHYHGKNLPITYKQHYLFQEQWEKNKISQQKISQNSPKQIGFIDIVLSIATTLIYFYTFWFTTIDFFFQTYGKIFFYFETYTLATVVTFSNIFVLFVQLINQKETSLHFKEFCKQNFQLIVIAIYLILKLSGVNSTEFIIWVFFQFINLLFIYLQARKRYQSIRLTSFALRYQYQTKVFDLVIIIFIIAHLISLGFFSVSKLHPQDNWMTPLNLDSSQYFTQYIYSFYFSTTTVLTVGYGDILPKNPLQVVIISMVQIFGIAMLGFVINQIGYCISSLQKSRQIIEKDLTTVQKLKKHYKMNPQLTHKVKTYLVNSKPDIDQLSPQQEKGILLKVNQEIRMDIMKHNMSSIVKSSIFFLCRWSQNLQRSISTKLIHVLFYPNDILYQPKNKERIYIIKAGKVALHFSKSKANKKSKNPLKTITKTNNNDVSDNCYGYTAAISSRPVKLYAVSNDVTSAYYIQKDKFLQSVNQKNPDIEFYHELKSKIEQNPLSESFEVPNLQNSKHHYNPSKYFVIRKYCRDQSNNSKRKRINRRTSKAFRRHNLINSIHNIDQIREVQQRESVTSSEIISPSETKIAEQNQIHARKSLLDNEQIMKLLNKNNLAVNFHNQFQSGVEYSNYYQNYNKSWILKKIRQKFQSHLIKNDQQQWAISFIN